MKFTLYAAGAAESYTGLLNGEYGNRYLAMEYWHFELAVRSPLYLYDQYVTRALALGALPTLVSSGRVATILDVDTRRHVLIFAMQASLGAKAVRVWRPSGVITAASGTIVDSSTVQTVVTNFVNYWNSVPGMKAEQIAGSNFVVLSSNEPFCSDSTGSFSTPTGYGLTFAANTLSMGHGGSYDTARLKQAAGAVDAVRLMLQQNV